MIVKVKIIYYANTNIYTYNTRIEPNHLCQVWQMRFKNITLFININPLKDQSCAFLHPVSTIICHLFPGYNWSDCKSLKLVSIDLNTPILNQILVIAHVAPEDTEWVVKMRQYLFLFLLFSFSLKAKCEVKANFFLTENCLICLIGYKLSGSSLVVYTEINVGRCAFLCHVHSRVQMFFV